MKKLLSILLGLIAMLQMNAQGIPNCGLSSIVKVANAPEIDGVEDAVWVNAPANFISKVNVGVLTPDFSGTNWRAMYDDDNLYILVQVKDSHLYNDSSIDWWEDDVVELFFDGNNSKGSNYDGYDDYQYGFRWNDTIVRIGSGSGNAANITFALLPAFIEGWYNAEIRIPWSNLKIVPSDGKVIGFDVSVDDDDDGGDREVQVAWNAISAYSYEDPSLFGNATLSVCAPTNITTSLSVAKEELYQINKVFDSAQYIGFDIEVNQTIDTGSITPQQALDITNHYANDYLKGSYILNQKNLYYSIGGMEYIQTDSFSYTIYPVDKMMMMTKNFIGQNSELFPSKTFVDLAIDQLSTTYSITTSLLYNADSSYYKRLKFVATDSTASYAVFSIDYIPDAYYPLKLQFASREYADGEYSFDESIDSLQSTINMGPSTQTVTMLFSNYKSTVDDVTSGSVFKDTKYVKYNRQRLMYEPSNTYSNYRLITEGFDNEEKVDYFFDDSNNP